MDSIGELLSSIVADYENISSLPNRELLSKSENIRTSLRMMVKHHLSDIQMLIKEVGKVKDQTTKTEMVLDFLHHLVSQFPHPVFAPSSAQCQSLSAEEKQRNFAKSKEFLFYVCQSLLRILAEPKLSKVHQDGLKLMLTIVELVKNKNIPLLKVLLKEILLLYVELGQKFQEVFVSEDQKHNIHIKLKSFKPSGNDMNDNQALLVIETASSLNVLCQICLRLIQPLVIDICQFASFHESSVWYIALFFQEHGDFEIKSASLKLLTSLLQCSEIPEDCILHYFVFCLVSVIEFCVSLLRGEDSSQTDGSGWKPFFAEACEFMDEIFALQKKSESCFQLCHVLGPVHTTTVIQCLSCEMNTLSSDVEMNFKEDQYMLLFSASITACKYFAVFMQTSKIFVTPSQLQFYSELCARVIHFLSKHDMFKGLHAEAVDIVSDGFICELQHLITINPVINLNNFDCKLSALPIHKLLSHSAKENVEKIIKAINDSGFGLEKTLTDCIAAISCLTTVAEIYSVCLLKANICDSAVCLKSSQRFISDVLLRKDDTVKLMKSFLRALSLYNPDWPGGKQRFIKFYRTSVRLVKTYLLALKILTQLRSSDIDRAVTDFTRTLILSFTLYVSLPWIESFNLEDLGSDFNAAGLKQSMVVPISASLRECEIDISNVKSLNEECSLALRDCMISIAICPGGKYTRWRSTILIKWALGEDCKLALPALSIIPIFLYNSSSQSVMDTILRHVKIIFKRSMDKVTPTNRCDSCVLGCYLILNSLLDNVRPHLRYLDKDKMKYHGRCCQCQLAIPAVSSVLFISSEYYENQDKPSKQLRDTISDVLVSSFSYFNSSRCGSAEENDDFCYVLMRDQFLELVSNFFKSSDKRTMSGTQKSILRSWFVLLQFYSGVGMDELISGVLQESARSPGWNSLLAKELEEMLKESSSSTDLGLRQHVIRIIGVIARSSLEEETEFISSELFSWSILLLFGQLSSTILLVQSSAFLELSNLPARSSKKITWKDIFQLHRHEICSCVAKSLLGSLVCAGKRSSHEILEDVSVLTSLSVEDFVRLHLPFILPEIVTSPRCESHLKVLSEVSCISRVDILMQNFKHIFCHAVVIGYDLSTLFAFLEKETRIKKESLLLLNFGSLVHYLVSHVSVNHDRVFSALNVITEVKLSSASSSSKVPTKSKTKSSLCELLQPHFLGILTFFNCQLRSSSVTANEKKRVLESLTYLFKLMDSRDVTAVRVKIINTLCLGQNLFKHQKWLSICCRAWDTFIRCIEPPYLAPVLSQVTVTLVPLLDTLPEKVSSILSYLVIDMAEYTNQHLHELYFLPDHPALINVQRRVKEEMKKRNQEDLVTHLTQAIHLMGHESSEVRVQALTRLRQTLREKQEKVQKRHLSSGRDITDTVMSQLVSSLLVGCRDNNKQIRLLCGQCLGQIGAIDPDRLVLSLSYSSSNVQGNTFTIDDPDFAFNLISELVKAFLAAKPTHQDISAYAMQELLKIYECADGARDTLGRRIWRQFSENMREVLEPHHTSRYLLKKSDCPLSDLKEPVLFRKANMTFRDWAGNFCALLMQMVYETNESSTTSRVFRVCSSVARNDINVALFLLPHACLQALFLTEHSDFIVQEVLAVLEHTEQIQNRNAVEFDSDSRVMRSSSAIEQSSSQEASATNVQINTQHARGTHLLQLSAQAIFTALDHATRWLRQTESTNLDGRSKCSRNSTNSNAIKNFLGRIPQLTIAQASFRCHAYTRALQHYEAHLKETNTKGDLENIQDIDFLQQLFVEMDEPDGVAGIAAVRLGKPTLSVQIKQLESTGKLQDACACYERAVQLNENDLQHKRGYIKCLMDLGQLSTAVCVIDGTLAKKSHWKNDLNSYRVEAAWRLGRWDMLDEYLSKDSKAEVADSVSRLHDWNTRLGELLLIIKDNQFEKFKSLLDDVYQDQIGPISAASMESGSYQRGYESVLHLHMLTELEAFSQTISEQDDLLNFSNTLNKCFGSWQDRIKPLQTSFKAREPVLALQRTMLEIFKLAATRTENADENQAVVKRLIGQLWLESAKNARLAGYLQTSYNALINSQDLDLPEFCIEHAKWLWHKGESHQALLTLQKGVADHFQEGAGSAALTLSEKMAKAKAMLLVARLMEESSSFDSNTVLKQFREVVIYMDEWEDSHFYAAKYYDKLMTAFMGENRSAGKSNHLFYIMHHYGHSLCYGTSHIYESLTKLLTVWFDYEANVVKLEKSNKAQNKEDAQRLIDVITDLRSRLPAYVFLTAFSQLVSRICHQHLPTFEELKQVVAMVITAYPRQALWTMMAISKSSYQQRAQRCKEIFQLAESKDRKLAKLLSDATRLTDKLLELCNKPVHTIQSLSMATHFKPLKRLVEESSFSEILLPLQRFMTVTLPQEDVLNSPQETASSSSASTSSGKIFQSKKQHDPFPDLAAYIVGFEDLVEVLPSLQRPKKISIRASDGKSYLFLCKPKDDLRKDARLMEFNAIVNKCLKRDSESRKRQLKIRTYAVLPLNEECGLIEWVPHTRGFRHILLERYKQKSMSCSNRELLSYVLPKSSPAVVPLNEECGLIEWVPNTQGLRNILLKIYKARDIYTTGKVLKSLQLPHSAPLEKKLEVFRNKLLPRHPPVFGDWFLATFSDPTSWYNARLAYARSTAVMSLVGYILGLGDRHGENILFDSTTGEAVHVDFNCLFNKGLSLDVPEIVPFRLTHNMTDAMGPMRYEGFFRCACEVVMRLLRQQREPLMSVLKTFIYDPLVEWSKRSRSGVNESGEIVNEKALSHVSDIDKRLRGIAAKNKGLPLSVEGHVHYLIQEATEEEKLCQMYIGWAPYM